MVQQNFRANVMLYLLPSVSQRYPLPMHPNNDKDQGIEE